MYQNLEHKAVLPYCYFDSAKNVVVLRLISGTDAGKIDVIWGDPFDFEKISTTGEYRWIYATEAMEIIYQAREKLVWQCEFEPPKTRRLKYGFRIETKENPAGGQSAVLYFSEKTTERYKPELLNEPHHHFFFPFVHAVDAPREPEWVPKTIWYQIFPERFFNGDKSNDPPNTLGWYTDKPAATSFFGGDLEGVFQKLPYLESLGVNGIFLNPIFTSPSNHKYDTEDYFSVDPHFGGINTVKKLVSAAHSKNMHVMFDGVFNHIGRTNKIWQDVLKNQEKSPYKDWFYIKKWPVTGKWTGNKHELGFDAFAFTEKMPKWNTENPDAREYLIKAAVFWIKECDIDGWRLDVSDEVSFDFWHDFCAACRREKSSFYIIGEMWHDASSWLLPPYFNAAMNYPLGFAIRDFFLRKIIDADTFTERLVNALSRYSALHNRIAFNLLDSHDTERALWTAGGDKTALKNAFTFLLCMPGSPCIYYGTEIGLTGRRDPDCRRPMPWEDDYREDETPDSQNSSKIAGEIDKDLLLFFQNCVTFRKTHIELIQNGSLSYSNAENRHVWTITGAKGCKDSARSILLVYDGTGSVEIEVQK